MDYKKLYEEQLKVNAELKKENEAHLYAGMKMDEVNEELKKKHKKEMHKQWLCLTEQTSEKVEEFEELKKEMICLTKKYEMGWGEKVKELEEEIKELKKENAELKKEAETREDWIHNVMRCLEVYEEWEGAGGDETADDLADRVARENKDLKEKNKKLEILVVYENLPQKYDELEQNYKLLQDEFDELENEHQNQEEELEELKKMLKLIFRIETDNICMEEILKKSTKAEKWEKLKAAIKESYAEDEDDCGDFDIWEFLGDELGLEPSGEEKEAVMFICDGCIITDRTATHE